MQGLFEIFCLGGLKPVFSLANEEDVRKSMPFLRNERFPALARKRHFSRN
jgi:hypothetical protein